MLLWTISEEACFGVGSGMLVVHAVAMYGRLQLYLFVSVSQSIKKIFYVCSKTDG